MVACEVNVAGLVAVATMGHGDGMPMADLANRRRRPDDIVAIGAPKRCDAEHADENYIDGDRRKPLGDLDRIGRVADHAGR